jgi:hypothetical protein
MTYTRLSRLWVSDVLSWHVSLSIPYSMSVMHSTFPTLRLSAIHGAVTKPLFEFTQLRFIWSHLIYQVSDNHGWDGGFSKAGSSLKSANGALRCRKSVTISTTLQLSVMETNSLSRSSRSLCKLFSRTRASLISRVAVLLGQIEGDGNSIAAVWSRLYHCSRKYMCT